MLEQIAMMLKKNPAVAGLVGETWVSDMALRGQMVRLYRDYYAGKHRLKLTAEMKKMMQISEGNSELDRYNANYCEMVVNTMADRLTVEGVDSLNATNGEQADTAQAWGDLLAQANRFDGLQNAVRQAALRDGETFVMGQYDDTSAQTQLYHEVAWDGEAGLLAIYDRQGREIQAAVKVWYEGDKRRANIYYPALIERYEASDSGELKPLTDPEDTTRSGTAPGIPVVHFIGKGSRLKPESELVNVIPLQDSLNRTLISMVMSAELTAFSLLYAVGWKPPSGLTPGMILHTMLVGDDGNPIVGQSPEENSGYAALLNSRKLERLEGGDLSQLIAQAEFIIGQIGVITSTPIPSTMGGDSQSGEALKQRDVRLLGKLNRCMVSLGNSWEDVWTMAARLQSVLGVNLAPETVGWSARWKSAEVRNDADILAAAKQLHEWGYERAALRLLSQSSLASFSDADIDTMMAEKAADSGAILGQVAGSIPGFANLSLPTAV